jgi:hypothetical protein
MSNVRAFMSKKNIRSKHAPKISALAFRDVVKKETNRRPPNLNSWFDMWHHHIDWNGDGKLSALHHQFHLWAIFRTLRRYENLVQSRREPCQVFAYVNEQSPENDAVYIHTANPNGTTFPMEPEVKEWLKQLPFWLSRHISLINYRVGVNTYEGEKYYFVQRNL